MMFLATLLTVFVMTSADQRSTDTFVKAVNKTPTPGPVWKIVQRVKGLQNVPLANVYAVMNDDSTKFVAIVVKESTAAPDGKGWYYNMRAIHCCMVNFRPYLATQVFASEERDRQDAIAVVAGHVSEQFGSARFWKSGMFAPSKNDPAPSDVVRTSLAKYPRWGDFPSWAVEQLAKDF